MIFCQATALTVGVIFGANLVQHFMLAYSRYSRYRTKSHDKSTISNGVVKTPRDNLCLTAIISIYKKLCFGRAFCYVGAFIERPRATDGRPYGCVTA